MILNVRYKIVALIVAMCSMITSCVKNDIPYPVVPLSLTGLYGDGVTTIDCDTENRVLKVELAEKCNIREVLIDSVAYTPEATLSQPLVGVLNMKYPVGVTLSFYQHYFWKIEASQPIERYFNVVGQIGKEVIDEKNMTITAYVDKGVTDEKAIVVERLKLGPADITTMSLDISKPIQFLTYKRVEVSYYDEKELWKLYVEHTDVKAVLNMCEAWATSAWLEAGGVTTGECGFRYREAGSEQWTEVDAADVTVGSGTFSTRITGLTPETNYEFLAFSGDFDSEIVAKRSDAATQMPNSGFEDWWKPSKIWYPYLSESELYWSTGNEGAATMNATLTESVADPRPGSSGSKAAQLSTKFIMRLAAGNLFVGEYARTDGVDGIVGFGQKFTSRPTALKGWVKYTPGKIDRVGSQPPGVEIAKGDMDRGMIYIALGDWTKEKYGVNPSDGSIMGTDDTPILICTKFSSTFFDPKSEAVIAYGAYEITDPIDEWTEFTIPLDYYSMERIPTHITVVCSASKYGDYFAGSSESVMTLDDFELVYE